MSFLQCRFVYFEEMISIGIHIAIIFILILLFQRKQEVTDRAIFVSAVFIKIVSGLLVGWLYWSYYNQTGDTYYIYEQAGRLFEYFQIGKVSWAEWLGFQSLEMSTNEFPVQNDPRTFFFVRWMSYLYALTQGEYITMAIYLSLLVVFATWKFVKRLTGVIPGNKNAIYLSFLFIPSVAFWSSGLLKETFMMTLLYFLGYFVIKWYQHKNKWYLFIFIGLCIWGLWLIKYYVPIVLLPIVLLSLIFTAQPGFLENIKIKWKIAFYFSLVILGGIGLAFLHPVFYSGRFFELIKISHDGILAQSTEAKIIFSQHASDITFFLKNLPLAWITGFFRPFIWEGYNAFSYAFAIEQLLFLIVFLYGFRLLFLIKFTHKEIWWVIGILLYSSVLAIVLGLSTPNFGSLIRYKVAYMPFLWFLFLWLIGKRLGQGKI